MPDGNNSSSSDGDVFAPPPPLPSLGLPQLPLVALLFLTRGNMPLEQVWHAFLSAAAAATTNASVGSGSAAAAAASSAPQTTWRSLFSIYTHPPPGFAYPPGSLFAGSEVEGRVEVQWGQHSVVSDLPLCGACPAAAAEHQCSSRACSGRSSKHGVLIFVPLLRISFHCGVEGRGRGSIDS